MPKCANYRFATDPQNVFQENFSWPELSYGPGSVLGVVIEEHSLADFSFCFLFVYLIQA